MIKYSFFVAAYNEEAVLPLFLQEAVRAFEALACEFEIVVVNDGSTDNTKAVLKAACEKDSRVKGISFSRNFGQQAAFLCGLAYARGEYMVFMDADLQDPPEVALQLLEKAKEGYDVVHARRKERKGETVFKRLTAYLYYRYLKRKTGLDLPLDCGDFCAISRKVADVILSLREHTRLLRAQTSWVGFKQAIVEFDRPCRMAGKTKYNLAKMIALAADGLVPNARKPLRFSSVAGALFTGLSLVGFITLAVLTAVGVDYGGIAAWILPALALGVGVLSLGTGLQNAYIRAIYEEVKDRPRYIVEESFNTQQREKEVG